jgi:hypothetical protein
MSNPPTLPTVTIPPRPRRWLRLFAALLIFFAGLVCGSGATVVVAVRNIQRYIHHPEEVPARITKYLKRRLDLSPGQADQIEAMIAKTQLHLQAIRRENQPRVQSELATLHDEVSQVLTENQRDKWDQIYDDALDRWMPPPPPAATQPPQ